MSCIPEQRSATETSASIVTLDTGHPEYGCRATRTSWTIALFVHVSTQLARACNPRPHQFRTRNDLNKTKRTQS
jgi:hypothetical protein